MRAASRAVGRSHARSSRRPNPLPLSGMFRARRRSSATKIWTVTGARRGSQASLPASHAGRPLDPRRAMRAWRVRLSPSRTRLRPCGVLEAGARAAPAVTKTATQGARITRRLDRLIAARGLPACSRNGLRSGPAARCRHPKRGGSLKTPHQTSPLGPRALGHSRALAARLDKRTRPSNNRPTPPEVAPGACQPARRGRRATIREPTPC